MKWDNSPEEQFSMPNDNSSREPEIRPGVEIDLKDNPGLRYFLNWAEVKDFLSQDITAWYPFFGSLHSQISGLGGPLANIYLDHQTALQMMQTEVPNSIGETDLNQSMYGMLEDIFRPYLVGRCIHSRSKVGMLILESLGPPPNEKFGLYIAEIAKRNPQKLDPISIQISGQKFPGISFLGGDLPP